MLFPLIWCFSYLELQSSGYKKEVRLHYTHGGRTFVESFQVHLADGVWHRLALWVSGAQVELLVDCKHHFKRVLHASPDRNFPNASSSHQGGSDSEFGDQLALWLGQRYVKHSLFMVSKRNFYSFPVTTLCARPTNFVTRPDF